MYAEILRVIADAVRCERIEVNQKIERNPTSVLSVFMSGDDNFCLKIRIRIKGTNTTTDLVILGNGKDVPRDMYEEHQHKRWKYPIDDPVVQKNFERFFWGWLDRRDFICQLMHQTKAFVIQDAMKKYHQNFRGETGLLTCEMMVAKMTPRIQILNVLRSAAREGHLRIKHMFIRELTNSANIMGRPFKQEIHFDTGVPPDVIDTKIAIISDGAAVVSMYEFRNHKQWTHPITAPGVQNYFRRFFYGWLEIRANVCAGIDDTLMRSKIKAADIQAAMDAYGEDFVSQYTKVMLHNGWLHPAKKHVFITERDWPQELVVYIAKFVLMD